MFPLVEETLGWLVKQNSLSLLLPKWYRALVGMVQLRTTAGKLDEVAE